MTATAGLTVMEQCCGNCSVWAGPDKADGLHGRPMFTVVGEGDCNKGFLFDPLPETHWCQGWRPSRVRTVPKRAFGLPDFAKGLMELNAVLVHGLTIAEDTHGRCQAITEFMHNVRRLYGAIFY